jgi:hypothetical protein
MSNFSSGAGLFPLPLITFPFRPRSRSRRVWQRYHRSCTVTTVTNNIILSLNQLAVSFCSSAVLYQARNVSVCRVSCRQLRLLAHIHQCAIRFVSRRTMDYGSSVVSDDHIGESFDFSFLLDCGIRQYSALPASAIPIEADKISLPSSSSSVDLFSLLPENIKNCYSSEHNLLRSEVENCRVRPSVLCASTTDYIRTILRMVQLGMIEFT